MTWILIIQAISWQGEIVDYKFPVTRYGYLNHQRCVELAKIQREAITERGGEIIFVGCEVGA